MHVAIHDFSFGSNSNGHRWNPSKVKSSTLYWSEMRNEEVALNRSRQAWHGASEHQRAWPVDVQTRNQVWQGRADRYPGKVRPTENARNLLFDLKTANYFVNRFSLGVTVLYAFIVISMKSDMSSSSRTKTLVIWWESWKTCWKSFSCGLLGSSLHRTVR